jgi:hypothetical protein
MNIKAEKIFFIKNQFWQLTIAASFQRAYVYTKDAKEETKKKFKKELFNYVEKLIENKYNIKKVEDDEHLATIKAIQKMTNVYGGILNDTLILNGRTVMFAKQLRFGICQKILNLYLKYLWCAGLIKFEPPHFPLDRLVQGKNVNVNWTELDDAKEYRKIINVLHPKVNKAQWELEEYNKILKNNSKYFRRIV